MWECICREFHRLSGYDAVSYNGHALGDLCSELSVTDFRYYMAPEVIARVLPRKYARWRRRTGTDYLPPEKEFRPQPSVPPAPLAPATDGPTNLNGKERH